MCSLREQSLRRALQVNGGVVRARGERSIDEASVEIMEMFGIIGAMPAAFVASAIYSQILIRLPLSPSMKRYLLWASFFVLGSLVLEWLLLATLGAVQSRSMIGPIFYLVHLALFLLAVPALANILVIGRSEPLSWPQVGLLSALLSLPVVLTQYGVAEALYGIDGNGGPFGNP